MSTAKPVATLPRGKCASRLRSRGRAVQRIRDRLRAAERPVESPEDALRLHPFTSKRFHVLLNSLFKVLFNFPSRYLSAIGLVQVFSLRWSLPPTFGLHSQTTRLRGSSKTRATGAPHGPDTLSGQGHDQEDLDARRRANRLPIHHISRRP